MQKTGKKIDKVWLIGCILVTGFGVGWLTGLSISPVVSIVITSITGIAATLIVTLSGLERKDSDLSVTNKNKDSSSQWNWNVTPVPLMVLIIGILFGSTVGILARNYSWLGSSVDSEVNQWVQAGLTDSGMKKEEIVQTLFASRYITGTVAKPSTSSAPNSSGTGTYLFAVSAEECEYLLGAAKLSETVFIDAVSSSTNRQVQALSTIVTDPLVLKDIVEQVLCSEEP